MPKVSWNPSFFCIGASSTTKTYAGVQSDAFSIRTLAWVGTTAVSQADRRKAEDRHAVGAGLGVDLGEPHRFALLRDGAR